MLERLTALCALDGVSGWEDEVRDAIAAAVSPLADDVTEDTMGNLLVFKKGRARPAGKIMLCAHMDEVGLIIKSVADDGCLRFGVVGGMDRRLLPGKRLRCGPDKIAGVVGVKDIHLRARGDKSVPQIKDMVIDIGAGSRAEALKKIALGDACAFDTKPELFGNGFFKAKAIDDRVGCAALIRLLEGELPYDCHFVFTVQEEAGLRGAFGGTWTVKPDIALIVEGTTGVDRPDLERTQRVSAPGEGVVLSYMDQSVAFDRGLFGILRDICEKDSIPWQLKRVVAGGTDAGAIQRSRAGVRVAGIAAAVRYIHAPASVASVEDMENLPRLALRFLEEAGKIDGKIDGRSE